MGACLVDPLTAVNLADEGDVQDDAQHIEVNEELLCDAGFGRIVGEEHLERGLDVEYRDGEFLQCENDELDAFVDIVDF